jgi:hypothetical protein
MSLEDRIRDSIDRRTQAVGSSAGVPEGLLRRVRRRIAATVALSLIGVVAVAGGGFAVVRSLQPNPKPVPGATHTVSPSPTPSEAPSPGSEAAVAQLVNSFMALRKAGLPPDTHRADQARKEMVQFLAPNADSYYSNGSTFPALYGGEGQETKFGDVSIDGIVHIESPTPSEWAVFVRIQVIYLGDSAPCPVTEQLVLGAGTDVDGQPHDLMVLSAGHVSEGWNAAPTAVVLSSLAAQEFACAFVAARLSGAGAEPYLSAGATAAYAAGDGGLRLYPPQPSQWGFWWIVQAEETDGAARVLITLNNTGGPDAIYEELTVGRWTDGKVKVLSVQKVPQPS